MASPARAPAACATTGRGDASKAFRRGHAGGPGAVGARAVDRRGRGPRRGARAPWAAAAAPTAGRAGAERRRRRRRPTPPSARRCSAAASSAPSSGSARPAGPSSGSASTRPARSCGRSPRRRPTAESVRELLGLTYYRLGRWKAAAAELEAFRDLSGSTEQHPVLADCYRALGRHAKVAELWEELRAASPERRARGRGPHRGRRLARRPGPPRTTPSGCSSAAKTPAKRPKEHHLRVDLRAGRPLRAGRRRAPRPPALRRRWPPPTPSSATSRARLRALRWPTPSCHTPSVGSARLPPPRPHPHRRRHPMSTTTVPTAGTNLTDPRRHAQPRRRAPHPPVRRPAGRPRAHRPPRGRAGRVRPGRLARPARVGRVAGRPARSSSSPAGSAAASSGPAASTQSRTEVVADPRRAHAARGRRPARRWRRRGLADACPGDRGCDRPAAVRHDGADRGPRPRE